MNDLLESQVRELLRQADGLEFDSVPASSEVIAAGARVVRRRRVVRATSAVAVAALLAVGSYAASGRPSANSTIIAPAATTTAPGAFTPQSSGVLTFDQPASPGAPALGPFTVDWALGTQGSVEVLRLTGSGLSAPLAFTQEQVDAGTAYAWLDSHTLLAVTRSPRTTMVVADVPDNQSSESRSVPAAAAEVVVIAYESALRDRARVGLIWRGDDGLAHIGPDLTVASLAIDDGHGGTATAWACPALNASGTFTGDSAMRNFWRADGYLPSVRFDNVPNGRHANGLQLPEGSWSTFVVEITGRDEVSFAADTTKPGSTVAPSQLVAKDGAWWAVFTVPGPSVGATSWISWRNADGTHHEGPVL